MSLAPHRLLGFAFASADLLMEVTAEGKISLAIGAAAALSGSSETALVGRGWRDFVAAPDHGVVQALFDSLQDGTRSGPVIVTLAGQPAQAPRGAALCACRLPQNEGIISCALTKASPVQAGSGPGGLHDATGFEAVAQGLFETARATGLELELALIQMGGLADARNSLPAAEAEALDARMAGALRAQSHGGAAAAGLGQDRFALVRQAGEAPEVLAERIGRLLALDETFAIKPQARALPVGGPASTSQMVRAVRYALDDFIQGGLDGAPPASLSEAMGRSVQRTLARAGELGRAVTERKFRLVYQPVVKLSDGSLHHHEALVRFGDNASPFPLIRMAEELDLIEPLDLAIVEEAVKTLVRETKLKLAVNVSGRTIGSDAFVQQVIALLGDNPTVRGRLMFELTESAAIDDLAGADKRLAAIRAEGCLVCLDDFGAGAASLAYLQQLSLDLVKIDGAYIRELQHGGRESAFIKHLVSMCAELGVQTLAEMVETAQVEDAVRRAGVDYAQGWLYGAPADKPQGPPSTAAASAAAAAKPASRRMGVVEGWG